MQVVGATGGDYVGGGRAALIGPLAAGDDAVAIGDQGSGLIESGEGPGAGEIGGGITQREKNALFQGLREHRAKTALPRGPAGALAVCRFGVIERSCGVVRHRKIPFQASRKLSLRRRRAPHTLSVYEFRVQGCKIIACRYVARKCIHAVAIPWNRCPASACVYAARRLDGYRHSKNGAPLSSGVNYHARFHLTNRLAYNRAANLRFRSVFHADLRIPLRCVR